MCHAQLHSVWIKRVSKCFVIPVSWIFDCKGLMSHVPHSAAFGLDQMCYAAGGSRRAPRPKAGVAPRPKADTCRLCVFLCCSGERRVVFVVKASAAARESQLWLAVAIASAGASESAVEVERPSPLVSTKSGYRSFCGFECLAF